MNIHYRILKKIESEGTILVRYWTDIVTENSIATSFDVNGDIMMTDEGFPLHCRTDGNITFFDNASPSSSDIIDMIKKSAPLGFLKIEELKINNPNGVNLSNVDLYTAGSFAFEGNINQVGKIGEQNNRKPITANTLLEVSNDENPILDRPVKNYFDSINLMLEYIKYNPKLTIESSNSSVFVNYDGTFNK